MTEVGRSGEIENGTMKEVSVDGREILLARADDQYYATDNRYPHMGGNLSRKVECLLFLFSARIHLYPS